MRKINLPENDIIDLYQSGFSTREIGKKFNVSKNVVERALKNASIVCRKPSEAKKLWWSKQSSETKKKFGIRASSAIKGKKRSYDDLCKRALGKQRNFRLSKYEILIWGKIKKHGFIPQYAIGKYNVDFALPKKKIAIEINGGHFHGTSLRKIKQDESKTNYLKSKGWNIKMFQVTSKEQVKNIAKEIIALI